jgi:hypothetical protein
MTGKTTSNPYEVAARAEKARGLAQFLYQNGEGISSKDVLNMTPEHWDMAAKGAATQFPEQWPNGMVKPSPQTRRLAIVELKKMEKSAPIAKQLSEKMASPDDVHAYAVAKGIDDSAAQQEFATSGYKIQ